MFVGIAKQVDEIGDQRCRALVACTIRPEPIHEERKARNAIEKVGGRGFAFEINANQEGLLIHYLVLSNSLAL